MSKPTRKEPPPKPHSWRTEHPDAKCPGHTKKEYRLLVKAAWAAGWKVWRGRKYIYCAPPDPAADIVKVPMTPSGSRTLENVKAHFRSAGLEL